MFNNQLDTISKQRKQVYEIKVTLGSDLMPMLSLNITPALIMRLGEEIIVTLKDNRFVNSDIPPISYSE